METKLFLGLSLAFQLNQVSQEKMSGKFSEEDESFRNLVYLREAYMKILPL